MNRVVSVDNRIDHSLVESDQRELRFLNETGYARPANLILLEKSGLLKIGPNVSYLCWKRADEFAFVRYKAEFTCSRQHCLKSQQPNVCPTHQALRIRCEEQETSVVEEVFAAISNECPGLVQQFFIRIRITSRCGKYFSKLAQQSHVEIVFVELQPLLFHKTVYPLVPPNLFFWVGVKKVFLAPLENPGTFVFAGGLEDR